MKMKFGIAIYRREPDEIREVTVDVDETDSESEIEEIALNMGERQLNEAKEEVRHLVIDWVEFDGREE